MLQPLVPYALRGAIWNQGTRNIDRAEQYRTLVPTVIRDWRTAWGMGDFPITIVQLPGQPAGPSLHADSPAAELRDAQLAARLIPKVGVVVISDLPTAGGTRPPDQQEVGRRVALWALATVHGQSLPSSGPKYLGHTIAGQVVRITFQDAEGGLIASDGQALRGFAIAGSDHRFVEAQARIVPTGVEVTSASVATPVAVRYAWSAPSVGNLGTPSGLPAAPFRTDSRPLSTQGRR